MEQTRERVQRFREKKREQLREGKQSHSCVKDENTTLNGPFKHGSEKKRAVDKVKQVFPVSPQEKAAVVFCISGESNYTSNINVKWINILSGRAKTSSFLLRHLKKTNPMIAVPQCNVVFLFFAERQ